MRRPSHRSRRPMPVLLSVLVALLATLLTAPPAAGASATGVNSAGASAAGASAALAAVPAGTVLYVAVPDADAVQVRDAATGTLLTTVQLPAGAAPRQLITAPGSTAVYVLGSTWVGVLDPATDTVRPFEVAPVQSFGMALSPDGSRLYVEDDGDPTDPNAIARLYEIALPAGTVQQFALLPTASFETSAVAVSQDGATVYVVGAAFNGAAQFYLAVSVADGRVAQRAGAGAYASVAVSSEGGDLFLGRQASNAGAVDVYDAATGAFRANWAGTGPVPRTAVGLLPAVGGQSLSVLRSSTNGNTGAVNAGVSRISTADGATLADWASSSTIRPSAIAQSTDGATVFVGATDGVVVALDAASLAVQHTIAVGGEPSALAVAVAPRAPVITSPGAATLVAGSPATVPVLAVASPVPTVAVTGTLPAGLTFTPGADGAGAITGTPTAAGRYELTVTATNAVGSVSAPLVLTVNPGAPARLEVVSGANQTAAPGAQFAEQLTARVTDANGNTVGGSLPVTFTVAPSGAATFAGLGSITVSSADGLAVSPFLTAGPTPGPLTVTATSAGLSSAAFPLAVAGTPPGAPTINALTGGDGAVTVAFTPGSPGTAATTGYRVTATDVTDPSRGGQIATGAGSPITVTGLTNGDTYTFTVTALTASGDGGTSAPSDRLTVGVPPGISGSPGAAVVGLPYSYAFTLTGAPTPTVAVTSGALPDGLSLSPTGVLSGVPTTPGTSAFALSASNSLGTADPLTVSLTVQNVVGAPTPGASLAALEESLRAAGPAGRGLAALIRAARVSVEQGRPEVACALLRVFGGVVGALALGRALTPADVARFRSDAQTVRTGLGCR